RKETKSSFRGAEAQRSDRKQLIGAAFVFLCASASLRFSNRERARAARLHPFAFAKRTSGRQTRLPCRAAWWKGPVSRRRRSTNRTAPCPAPSQAICPCRCEQLSAHGTPKTSPLAARANPRLRLAAYAN